MKGLCLIIWMLLTIVIMCSVFGLVMFIPKDTYVRGESTPSTWMHIGRKLLDAVISDK